MAAAIVDAFDEHPSELVEPPRLSVRRGQPPAVPLAGHRPPRIALPVDAEPILADEPDKQTAPTAVNAPGFDATYSRDHGYAHDPGGPVCPSRGDPAPAL